MINNLTLAQPDDSLRMLIHELRNPLTNISLANACIREIFDGVHHDGAHCDGMHKDGRQYDTAQHDGVQHDGMQKDGRQYDTAQHDGVQHDGMHRDGVHQDGVQRDTESIKTFTSLIAKNVIRLEQMLHEIIDAKKDAKDTFTKADICRSLDQALVLAEDRLFLHRIAVNKLYKTNPSVNGDEDKLTTAFLNIIINAVEAMEHTPQPVLDISVYSPPGKAKVVLRDNGKGMEQQEADKIFDMYYTSKEHGLGVGLSHTKEILKMHNATIAVNSLDGIGTSVVINF